MPMKQNPNCDMGRCHSSYGQVRIAPNDADPNGSQAIVCRDCLRLLNAWRRERNRELAEECKYPILQWDSLAVYTPGEAVLVKKLCVIG